MSAESRWIILTGNCLLRGWGEVFDWGKCEVWKRCRGYRSDSVVCNKQFGENHLGCISCSFFESALKRKEVSE